MLCLCFCLFFLVGGALAQGAFDEMRSNLEGGYYAIAAQVLGPSLIRDYPEDAQAHYLYAQALYLTGDYPEARQALGRALALQKEPNADFEHLNGLLYAAEGDSARAAQLLEETFARSQDYRVTLDWGRVAWQMGDYEGALEAFNLAAATDRGQQDIWAQLNRGRVLKALERYPEAIAAFNEAILISEANDPGGGLPSPGYVEAFFRLGEIYEALGELPLAQSSYEAARASDPSYTPAVAALERLARASP